MARVIFGQLFTAPTAVVQVDDSALSGQQVGGSGSLALVGIASGGKPDTPLRLTSPQQARRVLQGGPLLSAALRAFSPSADIPGAPVVYAIRVNKAEPAKATLAATAGASIDLTSTDYGASQNQIRVKIAPSVVVTGTQAGIPTAYSVSVQNGPTLNTRDPLQRKAIALMVVDSTTTPLLVSATATVANYTDTTVTPNRTYPALTITTTPVAAPGTPVVTRFDLTQYTTLQTLVDAINNSGIAGVQAAVASYSPTDPSISIDETAAPVNIRVAIAAGGTPVSPYLYANLRALLDFFNRDSAWVTAVASTAVGAVRQPPATTATWTYLAGANDYGTDLATTPHTLYTVESPGDWQDALNAALPLDVSIISVVTGDEGIHGMLQQHVNDASSLAGMHERVAVIGGDAGEDPITAEGRARALGDARFLLVYPGGFDIDPSTPYLGNTIPIPPYLLAAQLAGQLCGGKVADPLTHRFIALRRIEQILDKDTIDELLDAGVCPVEVVTNRGFRVVQSRSTWTEDTNFRRVEISTMRASDELVKRIRFACSEQLIGRVVNPGLLQRAYSIVDSVLSQANTDNLIVGTPGWRNLVISAEADIVIIDFEAAIAIPANFVQITAHLTAFSSSTG